LLTTPIDHFHNFLVEAWPMLDRSAQLHAERRLNQVRAELAGMKSKQQEQVRVGTYTAGEAGDLQLSAKKGKRKASAGNKFPKRKKSLAEKESAARTK
jgi:hypothetical protein